MNRTANAGAPALAPAETLHRQATELLQELIRCACVNDGSPDSGHEIRAVRLLQDFLTGVEGPTRWVQVQSGVPCGTVA